MTSAIIRIIDVLLAVFLLLLAGLPMLAIAITIKRHDGGPALFRQERVGRARQRFTVLKFRTMRIDREGAGQGTLKDGDKSLHEANARFQRTMPKDPRITPIGRLLRPSHLDELPQLFNILRGEMSFVGVRPDTPVQEADYQPDYWRVRHIYKPGLTGPAQLRTDPLTFVQRNVEEMRWIKGYGLRMYLAVLVRTSLKVFQRSSF